MLVGRATNSQPERGPWTAQAPIASAFRACVLTRGVLIGLLSLALIACAGKPRPHSAAAMRSPGAAQAVLSPAAKDVLFNAIALVGTPYRYGGNTPEGGFDCSGLVGYVYRHSAGVNLPRTTADIASTRARSVAWGELISGDLVLFGSGGVDHIGIYVGEGRFVHAPSSGGTVRLDRLTDGYWSKRFRGGKRLL